MRAKNLAHSNEGSDDFNIYSNSVWTFKDPSEHSHAMFSKCEWKIASSAVIQNFRSYDLAVAFHKQVTMLKTPSYLRDQLLRASSSVVMNLPEGAAKPTKPDRIRFYAIAFGSLREVQSILGMIESEEKTDQFLDQLDHLSACLFKLV